MLKKLKSLSIVLLFILPFSSCDVPCNEGFLWITNSTSSTIYVVVEGYYNGEIKANQIKKMDVVPDTPIKYTAYKAGFGSGASLSNTVTVDDCQTLAVEIE